MNTEKNCKRFFSRYFSVYSGTFDYLTAFEYNYDRNLKEDYDMRDKKYYIALDDF